MFPSISRVDEDWNFRWYHHNAPFRTDASLFCTARDPVLFDELPEKTVVTTSVLDEYSPSLSVKSARSADVTFLGRSLDYPLRLSKRIQNSSTKNVTGSQESKQPLFFYYSKKMNFVREKSERNGEKALYVTRRTLYIILSTYYSSGEEERLISK